MLEQIFPSKCIFCGKLSSSYVCQKCFNIRKLYEINQIQIYDFIHLYICSYEFLKDQIVEYKFYNKKYVAYGIANILLNNKNIQKLFDDIDYIIPIPINKQNLKLRRKNQINQILEIYNQKAKVKVKILDILEKSKQVQMSKLDEKQRLNMKDFIEISNKQSLLDLKLQIDEKSIADKKFKTDVKSSSLKLLLFDDIATTGSTLKVAKRKLENFAKINNINIEIKTFSLCIEYK